MIALGALTRALGLAVVLVMVAGGRPVGWLIPGLAIDGFGMGLALAPIMGTVLARVAPHQVGAAAGVLTTTQQVGSAVGVGVAGIVFYGSLSGGVPHAFEHGLIYLLAVALVIAVLVQFLPRTTIRA